MTETTTTESPIAAKTLAEIYVEKTAETLDFYARSARGSLERTQKKLAGYAQEIAEGLYVGTSSVASYAKDYAIERDYAESVERLAAYLRTGDSPSREGEPATPEQRIASSALWYDQEVNRALSAIAGDWSITETQRATAKEVEALRDAERDGWDAARSFLLATDDRYVEDSATLRQAKEKLAETQRKSERARAAEKVAEYAEEIARLREAIKHFESSVSVCVDLAERAVFAAIPCRIVPRVPRSVDRF